jgi:PmbA protein
MDAEFWKSRLGGVFDSYELCFVTERLKKFEAADGALLTLELKEEEGISLRGIKDGKMAFSYTYRKGEEAAAALVENVVGIAPFLEKDEFYTFPQPYGAYPAADIFDSDGLALHDDVKIASLIEMESTMRALDKRIATTRNCELHEVEMHLKMLNSNGLEAESRKTIYSLGGLAVAADAEEVSWYDWSWSERYAGLDALKLGRKIAQKALSFLGGQVLDTGTYTGILTPGAACQMLEILSPSFLSENLYKNKTRLKEKAGQQCFSPLLTIVDSGLKGMGAFSFDGEGVPSQENVLVKDGVFQGFLYDTYYANRLKGTSTGNAVRGGIKEPPRCGERGFFIANGAGDAIAPSDGCLVIEELMGTHTANTVTGDFSVGAVGHYYSNGAAVPFQGVIFSGNLYDLLMQVKAVGSDLRFYGSYGAPTLLIEGMKISGK